METVRNCQELSDKQNKAISVILQSRTIAEGCKKAKIARETFYTWLKEPAFKKAFEDQRKELIDLAFHELKISAADAVNVLRKLLSAKNEGIQFKTATAIIENVLKGIQIENLEERLTEIERRILKK